MIRRIRSMAVFLANMEIWAVGLGVAAAVVTTRALPFALGIAALFWLLRWVAYGRPTVRTPGDWSIGLLVLMVPVTLWATALPDITRPQVYRLLTGIALYYAILNWAVSAARLRLLAMGVVLVGLLLALSAPVSVRWVAGGKLIFIPEAIYRELPLLLPDPIHVNVMAGTLVILLPCALAPPLFSWGRLSWFERALAIFAILLMSGVLVLTKSRGGLMALAALLVVMAALRWRHGWLAAPVSALAGGLVIWRIGLARILDLLAATQALGGLDGRLEVWSRALYMTQDFPFTGIGMGTFKQVANALYPFFLAGPDADIPHAHDLFLQVAVDLGLPGLIAWSSVLLLVICLAWQVYHQGRRSGDRWLAGLGAGLFCGQVALIVHGLTDAVTWGTKPAVVVWVVWGLAIAAYLLGTRPTGVAPGREVSAAQR